MESARRDGRHSASNEIAGSAGAQTVVNRYCIRRYCIRRYCNIDRFCDIYCRYNVCR